MNVELKIEYSWVALTAGFLWVDTPWFLGRISNIFTSGTLYAIQDCRLSKQCHIRFSMCPSIIVYDIIIYILIMCVYEVIYILVSAICNGHM